MTTCPDVPWCTQTHSGRHADFDEYGSRFHYSETMVFSVPYNESPPRTWERGEVFGLRWAQFDDRKTGRVQTMAEVCDSASEPALTPGELRQFAAWLIERADDLTALTVENGQLEDVR